MQSVDVVIVGAGPAGVGMALELNKIEWLEYAVLESNQIGESFRRWPSQTRLITPSFFSNPYGLADLNAIDPSSSPASFSGVQHLSGDQYADYLSNVADEHMLPIIDNCKVLQVEPQPEGGFLLETERGKLFTQFLIWACGEFQYPKLNPFPGGEFCHHYALIDDWQHMEIGSYTVIGGYESALDSAINLLKLGCYVRLLVRSRTWDVPDVTDPSLILSPYTRQRLHAVQSQVDFSERLTIEFDVHVKKITSSEEGKFRIHASDGRFWDEERSPILGTGFINGGGAQQITDLWQWSDNGHIELSQIDESIKTPGLFLVGPQVQHDEQLYCFIYKFRQRFTRISQELALRMDLYIEPPEESISGEWGPFGNNECCVDCEC